MTAALVALAFVGLAQSILLLILGSQYVDNAKRYLSAEAERIRLDAESVGLRGQVAELEHSLAAHKAALLDQTAKRERAEAAAVAHLDGPGLVDLANGVLANADGNGPGASPPTPVSDEPTARLRGAAGAVEELR